MRGLEQIPWLYDAGMTLLEATGMGRWRLWLARAEGRTLDIGCGTGRSLPLFSSSGNVVGLDPAADALLRARRRSPGTPLVRASAEALPFRDGCFDTIVSGLALCSIPEVPKALDEMRRVTAIGGQLRAMEHVRAAPASPTARLQDAFQPFWTWLTGGCRPNRDTEAAVIAAGWTIEADGRRSSGVMRRFVARPGGA